MSRLIQFLSFDGCPLAEDALIQLRVALSEIEKAGRFDLQHVDLMAPETPDTLRGWGSPTILVDGKDLIGQTPGDAMGCRVYARPGGVPRADEIVAFLAAGQSGG